MNTKNDVINDAYFSVAENMNEKDVIARLLLVAISVAALLGEPAVLLLNLLMIAAVYLFTTAILRWDPFYALVGMQLDKKTRTPKVHIEGLVSRGVGLEGSDLPANDPSHPDENPRRAG